MPEYKIIRGEQIPVDVKRHKRFHYDEINDSKGFEKDFRTFEQYSFGRHNNDNEEYRGQGLSSYEYDEFGGFKGQGGSIDSQNHNNVNNHNHNNNNNVFGYRSIAYDSSTSTFNNNQFGGHKHTQEYVNLLSHNYEVHEEPQEGKEENVVNDDDVIGDVIDDVDLDDDEDDGEEFKLFNANLF